MRELTERERGYFWLSLIDGMSSLRKRELLDSVGGIENLYERFEDYVKDVIDIAGESNYAKLSIARDTEYLERKLQELDKYKVDFITEDSEYYPTLLKEIQDPPLLIYYKGNKEILKRNDTLAVVGSREPTRYGRDITRELVKEIVYSDVVIVSGLARGIDSIAHKTALSESKVTIAVVACGLDRCYPADNHELMDRIVADGIVISEYPIGAVPYAYRFPERNRIISGLSKGILVTEAGRNSGSLITMNFALEQNRNVYIVPGNINSPHSYGCNDALKQLQGALVTEANDILKDYSAKIREQEPCDMQLDVLEEKLVDFIHKEDRHFDEIIEFADINVNSLLALLSKLELLGLIQKLPGNYYGK